MEHFYIRHFALKILSSSSIYSIFETPQNLDASGNTKNNIPFL